GTRPRGPRPRGAPGVRAQRAGRRRAAGTVLGRRGRPRRRVAARHRRYRRVRHDRGPEHLRDVRVPRRDGSGRPARRHGGDRARDHRHAGARGRIRRAARGGYRTADPAAAGARGRRATAGRLGRRRDRRGLQGGPPHRGHRGGGEGARAHGRVRLPRRPAGPGCPATVRYGRSGAVPGDGDRAGRAEQPGRQAVSGHVTFVGAGPGAADLITVRGADALRVADVVVWAASLVHPDVLGYAREGAEIVDAAELTLEATVDSYRRAAADGLHVVRLHSGDPALWGALQEQLDACGALGLAVEV